MALKVSSSNGRFSASASTSVDPGAPLACEGDHLFAVIQTGRAGALRQSVTKQKTAPTTHVEHVVT